MTPFWIVNFLEGDSVESFFKSYWTAVLSNTTEGSEPLKFFHITDGKEEDMTKEKLNEIASKHLTMNTPGVKKFIPAFTTNQNNSLSVFFIGDITQGKTIERFHTWAAYLRAQTMIQPWFSINSVSMYAILLRPETTTIEDEVLNDRVRGFLNELNSLEHMNENYRPFDHVLFLQASTLQEDRLAAEQSACLAAYHIARTDGRCFGYDATPYIDANSTAVFFETSVQKEIDAYNLGAIILKDLTDNNGEEFFNDEEARAFVDSNQNFIDSFKPVNTKKFLISEAPQIPNLKISKFHHNLNIFNIIPIWREYDAKHIENVITHVTEELKIFERDFIQHLNMRQHKFIFGEARDLLKYVFQMFCDKDERFKHIGIIQAFKVLELFNVRISNAFKSISTVPSAFLLPKDLDKLLAESKQSGLSVDALKKQLEDETNSLPKFKRNALTYSSLTGVVLSAALCLLSPLALLILPTALLCGALAFMSKVNKLEQLKDLFVGAKLNEIRKHLDEHAKKLQEKTAAEMRQYMKWIKDKKLAKLQEEMHTIAPPDFHFQTSKLFQPLIYTQITGDTANQPTESGSFGTEPLVKNVPPVQIYCKEKNEIVNIYDLLSAQKDSVQALVHELMFCEEAITDTEEEGVSFEKHETSIIGNNMLLLLDVSGSMSGDMDALKKYVHNLESVGNISWIAFDDKVVASSKEAEVDNLSAGGGTCYIPAIEKAVEWLQNDTFDTVILLSDGCPFESQDAIISAAEKLNMPLNTIAVGNAAEDVLTNIAISTGGKEVTVESFEKISTPDVWKNEIMPNIEVLSKGNYTFGELMKHTHIEACASALRKFSLHCIQDYSLSIPVIFAGHINKAGFEEWLTQAEQRNTLSPSAPQMQSLDSFATAKERDTDKMETVLKLLCREFNIAMQLYISKGEPDMVVSLSSLRPMSSISDLQWAASMKHDDATINDPQTLKELLGNQAGAVNIYDEPITA